MAWIKRHLIAFAAIAVLIYLLVPNIVVAAFSFNDPKGRSTTTSTSSRPRAGPTRVARKASASRSGSACRSGHRVAGRHRARHDDRLRPRPLPLPWAVRDQPADLHADGHARGRHGLSLLTLFLMLGVPSDRRRSSSRTSCSASRSSSSPSRRGWPPSTPGSRRPRRTSRPPLQTFLRVTLPLAAPGIAAGACSPSRSASTTTSSPTSTRAWLDHLPDVRLGRLGRGVPVQVYVIGTVMFLLALIVVMAGQVLSSRRNRQVA